MSAPPPPDPTVRRPSDCAKRFEDRQRVMWDLGHGVVIGASADSGDWQTLPASYFIYAYFLFDIVVNQCTRLPLGIVLRERPDTEERRKKLLDAAIGAIGPDSADRFRRHIDSRHAQLKAHLGSAWNLPDWQWLQNARPVEVREDKAVSQERVSDFLTAVSRVTQGHSPDFVLDLKRISAFIYAVRNRVVHGSKSWAMVQQRDQASRFLLYTVLIHATMDLIWNACERAAEESAR